MKVIKQGKGIKPVMRVICKVCESELEVDTGDLKYIPGEVPGDSDLYTYQCPCCSYTNYLKPKEVTEEMRLAMNK